MSDGRCRTLLAMDLRSYLRSPLIWFLVFLLFWLTVGLASGNVSIDTGDSTIGGEARAWITSEYAIALMLPIVTFLAYSFFVAVAAGMVVPRDDELKTGAVLHATRLQPHEYIWSRFSAVLLVFLMVLALHLLLTIVFNQLVPNDQADLIRGPFQLVNYLRPTLVMALPFLVFLTGASFAVGALTRRPILVFVTPVALFLVNVFFLWTWAPSWLDLRLNRLLMWLEPSGYRWLMETWLKVDRGVELYNTQPVGYDLPFLLSRLAWAAVGIAMVALASRRFAAALRGPDGMRQGRFARLWRRREAVPAKNGMTSNHRPLAELAMGTGRPALLRTVIDVLRFEVRNLLGQPGLYIFIPLILIQTVGSGSVAMGPMGTEMLLTPGMAAVGAANTLNLLICLLLLFYTVESINREWATGLAPIYYASPASTTAVLTGKLVANALVGILILVAAYLGSAGVMLFQGRITPSPMPFLVVWGLLLVPTLIIWSAFVTALFALTRSRVITYGLALGAMVGAGWRLTQGEMSWLGNWNVWGVATWTDMGGLQPNLQPLLLNRLLWLAVAAVLVALTVRIFPRRDHDPACLVTRLQPKSLLRTAGHLALVGLPAMVLAVLLWFLTSQGFQGDAAERREEEYRGRNLVTWLEAETPRIVGAELDLELQPDRHWFQVTGSYQLLNAGEQPVRRFPMSVGDHFEQLSWTVDGQAFEPESWARMMVFNLPEPLPPAGTVTVGFSLEGRLPRGMTKNGGGLGAFILPCGVVLRSFESEFLPVPYFEDSRGVDEDNRLEPRQYEDGYWLGTTPPVFGGGSRYPVRTRITGPARFQYNGVGVLESEVVADGQRTVVWRTDHPVNFFNVVAGEWQVWQGDGAKVYYFPGHDYNLEEIGPALEAARRYYSEWFYPYPWQELKLSEFPALASYAQGFPTNITMSEGIGFLTRSTSETRLAFMVTAHEAAHQWWGNILLPGRGPGGEILAEGMAHFSTLLLTEQVHGLDGRIQFARRIEEMYGDRRQVDSERPLFWTDGSKAGDTTVMYDKGGWVFWMLLNQMGRDQALAGIQDFIRQYALSDDYPLLQDFLAVMRSHSSEPEAFDRFCAQWFDQVVVPEYRFDEVSVKRTETGSYQVEATIRNIGSGCMPVQVAAVRGERFPENDDDQDDTQDKATLWQEQRTTVVLAAGEQASISLSCDFEPEQLVVDPDALVLMLEREQAVHKLS